MDVRLGPKALQLLKEIVQDSNADTELEALNDAIGVYHELVMLWKEAPLESQFAVVNIKRNSLQRFSIPSIQENIKTYLIRSSETVLKV